MKGNKILIVGGIIFASEVAWYLYQKLHSWWSKSTKNGNAANARVHSITYSSEQSIAEVMFFSKESNLCREHLASEAKCLKDHCPVGYLRKLKTYINQAEWTLDVCMYALTCYSLSDAIVNAHKRGVLVRIITDRRMACNAAAQTALFHNNGVTIHLEDSDALMHHKFVIVDKSIVITGSMNWTMSAFFENFDNVLITNHRSLVEPFVDEFDRLWKTLVKPKENFERPIQPALSSGNILFWQGFTIAI